MATYNFQELIVWQRAMILVEETYSIAKTLPKIEQFALADQIRRSAISVPSNIAEGQKRLSNKETVQFSSIALGSLGELQTQLILCERLHGLETKKMVNECEQITKMLTSLIKNLRNK